MNTVFAIFMLIFAALCGYASYSDLGNWFVAVTGFAATTCFFGSIATFRE